MYKYIVDPKTKQKFNIFSKLGNNILQEYKNSLLGGSNPIKTQDYIEINSVDFALNESVTNYLAQIDRIKLETCKVFIVNKVKEDLKFIRGVINLYRHFITTRKDKFSNEFKSALDIPLLEKRISIINNTRHPEFNAFVKYYVQLYTMIFIKVNINADGDLAEFKLANSQYLEQINHPRFIIEEFLNHHRAELDTILNSFAYPDTDSLKSELIRPHSFKSSILVRGGCFQKGGGGWEHDNYQLISNVLEGVAEPRHDFGGTRSYAATFFSSNYYGELTGENPDANTIKKINEILNLKNTTTTSWLYNFVSNTGLNIKKMLKSSNLEPLMFNKIHINKNFQKENDVMFLTKLKYFALKNRSDDTFSHWIINSDNNVNTVRDVDGFKLFMTSLLDSIDVTTFIYDTGAGMSNLTNVKNRIDFKKSQLVPLANLWDPASASIERFKQDNGTNDTDDADDTKDKISKLYMAKSDTSFPKRTQDDNSGYYVDFCDICKDDYTNCGTPLKLTIYSGFSEESIYLKSGFSVKELSIVIQKIMEINNGNFNFNYDLSAYGFEGYTKELGDAFKDSIVADKTGHTLSNGKSIVSYERVLLLINLIDLHTSKLTGSVLDKRKELIKILLDLKKSGDWGLINWVDKFNNVSNTKSKAVLISGDKLCTLKSIQIGNPTMFGSTRKLTDSIGESDDEEIHLGIYLGKNFELKEEQVVFELNSLRNLLGEEFFTPELGLQPLVQFKALFDKKFPTLSGKWLQELKTNLIDQNRITREIYDKNGYFETPYVYMTKSVDETQNTIFNNVYMVLNDNINKALVLYNNLKVNLSLDKIKKDSLKNYLNQAKLIINIISPMEKFYKTNINEIDDLLKSCLDMTIKGIAASSFKGITDSYFSDDLKNLFGTDSYFEEKTNTGTQRRSGRIVGKMINWLDNFDRNISSISTQNLETTNCSTIITERVNENIRDIIVWTEQFLSKTIELSKIQYVYETIPNIYNQIYSYLDNIDFYITGQVRDSVYKNIINESIGYQIIEHYKTPDKGTIQNFELTDSDTVNIEVAEISTSEANNLDKISGQISTTSFLLQCILNTSKKYSSDIKVDGILEYMDKITDFKEFIESMNK